MGTLSGIISRIWRAHIPSPFTLFTLFTEVGLLHVSLQMFPSQPHRHFSHQKKKKKIYIYTYMYMTGYSIIYMFIYNIQPHYPSTRAVKAPELTDTATPIAFFTRDLLFFGSLDFTLFLTLFAVWFRCLPAFYKLPCSTSTRSGLACNCVFGGCW